MLKPYVDLHTHSTSSDGRLSAIDLIRKAYASGIRVLSITDHNYTEDLTALREIIAAEFDEMTLVQGAEISTLYTDGKGIEHELHIVALGFDPNNPDMKALLTAHQLDRKPFIDAILKKLRDDCGIDIGTYESIQAQFPSTKYIGRMVLAQLLFEKGYTSSIEESFQIFLSSHGERRAYVKNPHRYSSLEEVVRTIIQAQGTPIIPHLLYFDLDNGNRTGGEEKERLVRTFKELVTAYGGTGGLEVYYTRYNMNERLYLLQMARKYDLLISGGSDYHQQESWETLEHHLSCSACQDLLDHLGVKVNYPLPPAPLYVLSGFSGVGKGTITEQIKDRQINGKDVALIQSYTNRPPRFPGENYFFVTPERFAWLAEHNLLLEYNNAYVKNSYGTPVRPVAFAIKFNKSVLLEIDRVGLVHLLTDGHINPNLVHATFVAADPSILLHRLRQRGTADAQILLRLSTAIEESYYLHLYDAVIINDNLDNAIADVIAAFEGRLSNNSFNPIQFRTDMRRLIESISEKTAISSDCQSI